jgi:hypothetical protein
MGAIQRITYLKGREEVQDGVYQEKTFTGHDYLTLWILIKDNEKHSFSLS